MDKMTASIIGGVYLALCQGLSDEGIALANDCLWGMAKNSPPDVAEVLQLIARSAMTGREDFVQAEANS